MFETEGLSLGAPDAFLFEHFLPFINKLLRAYGRESESVDDLFSGNTGHSQAYIQKKLN